MRVVCLMAGLVAALALGPSLFADDPASDEANGTATTAKLHDLNLSDEQMAKIESVRKECRPKVEAAAQELSGLVKDEMEKVRGVLTPEQREKLQAMRELRKEHRVEGLAQTMAHLESLDLTDAEMAQMAKVREEYRPRVEQALMSMRGILTDEQKKMRVEGLKAGKSHREVWQSLNITDEQKGKIESACKEVRSLVTEEMGKIKECLSPEQQAQVTEMKDERREEARDRLAAAVVNLQDLGLTDDQKTQIAAIRTEFRPKIHEAGNKLRAAVREELSMILDTIKG